MMFGVLGPLLAADDDGTQITVAAARQRALLAALLVRANRTVPVDELAELIWDTAPPAGAPRTVRSYVVRLRRALGPAVAARIVTRAPGYRCEIAEDELDVLRFAALCRESGAAVRSGAWRRAHDLLTEALGLWRGAPLEDIASQTLRQEYTEGLEQERLQAIEWRIEADLHLGRHEELVPELQALAGAYPLREHGHAQLMLALYRCGRVAEALEAFRRARRVLVRELGIQPGPELRALQEKILAADPGLAAPASQGDEPEAAASHAPVVISRQLPPGERIQPRELPPAVPHFTGRSAELQTLTRLLDRPGEQAPETVVISAIGGTAGVGKTALAVHWAHQVAGWFPDGQLFVNLRGFDPAGTPLDAGTVVRRFLAALAVRPERIPSDLDAQAGLYRSLLAGKRMLIILDNARDSGQVRPLLPGAGGCMVVVTSRNRLTDLVALDGAVPVQVGPLTRSESRELLAWRLGDDQVADRAQTVDDLIELCARLPLALNIASARPAASLEALLDDLRDERCRLDTLSAGPGAADVRAVLSWSFHALDEPAARLLCLLSLHPGPDISLLAAAAIAALPVDVTRDTLRELLDAHLLTEPVHRRYCMHDLLRTYAAEQSRRHLSSAERAEATGRMLDYYLCTVHAAALIMNASPCSLPVPVPRGAVVPERFPDPQQARVWCRDEQSVLVAVTTGAARDGHDTHAWQLACSTGTALESTGHWQQHLALIRVGLRAAEHAGDLPSTTTPAAAALRSCAARSSAT